MESRLEKLLKIGATIGIIGVISFGVLGLARVFGVRKTEDIYTFKYQGKPAVIKREDVRWGPDRIYFLLNEQDKLIGTLITDEGKEAHIYPFSERFGMPAEKTYCIRDAPKQQ